MSSDWVRKPLGSLCEVLDSKRKPITKRDRKAGPYPYFGATGILDHVESYLFDEPLVLVGEDGAKWASGERTSFGTVGKIWVNNHAHVLRPDREKILDEWLINFLNHSDLSEFVTGLTVPKLNQGSLVGIRVPVPTVAEQRRIVAVLDKAFEGIAIARAYAEKNLQNARDLFRSQLWSIFSHSDGRGLTAPASKGARKLSSGAHVAAAKEAGHGDERGDPEATKTGGREATLRRIPGDQSLSVCMPSTPAKAGWKWSVLTDLARLESGHTPSRKHPEYWVGSIPWIGIQDAREHHGQSIADTEQHTNDLGIENSSARVLPTGTVCLSRTASVGYVVVMGIPMATSQDFVNWVCSDELLPNFLKYIFLAEGRDGLLRYASGSVHQTIYFPEAKAFCICHPDVSEQDRIVRLCDSTRAETERLESIYQRKLASLDELKQSLLHQAFSGLL